MVSLRSIILNMLRIQRPPKGSVQIGAFTAGNPFIISFFKGDRVIVGKFCSIGADVVMIPTVGHIPPRGYDSYRVSTFPLAQLKRGAWRESYSLPNETGTIIVGNEVWIGARAIILSGVKIGDGAIIGAGAVVTHDVPPYAVVGGVPARILKYRYPEDQIARLLKIAWWDWSIDKILANLEHFYGKVDDFIRKFSDDQTRDA